MRRINSPLDQRHEIAHRADLLGLTILNGNAKVLFNINNELNTIESHRFATREQSWFEATRGASPLKD